MSWLKQGSEGREFYQEEKKRREQKAKEGGDTKSWRFYLKKGGTGYVVFIDNLRTFLLEHQYKKGDNYYNYATCLRDIEGECPLCDNDNNPSLVSVTTIIDFTEHKKKDGSFTEPTKKLMVVKKGGTERLLKRQDKLGELKFKKFEIYRSDDDKAERTGTDIDYEKDVDPEVLKKFAPTGIDPDEWIKPFNYDEIFKPMTPAEMRAEIGLSEPVGAAESAPADEPAKEPAKTPLKDMI